MKRYWKERPMKTLATTFVVLGALAPGLALAQTTPSLSASHARSAMTEFGCNGITALGVAADGAYHGQCTKGGKLINVTMDKSGKVSEASNVSHITEGHARYALTSFGCSNISQLGNGPGGTWHGQCYKGGAPTNVMVDAKGVASAASGTHVTEGSARSALTDYGCSNISTLSMTSEGGWVGQCAKGGRTQNVSVDADRKVSAN
jgi:hypothetical protein